MDSPKKTASGNARNELVNLFVLDAISDDYEDMERIANEVHSLGSRCGLSVTDDDISQGLITLITRGLAKAYRLYPSHRPPEEIQGVPQPGNFPDLYFLITDKGTELQLAGWDQWPFDENNELRKDWSPPSN